MVYFISLDHSNKNWKIKVKMVNKINLKKNRNRNKTVDNNSTLIHFTIEYKNNLKKCHFCPFYCGESSTHFIFNAAPQSSASPLTQHYNNIVTKTYTDERNPITVETKSLQTSQ